MSKKTLYISFDIETDGGNPEYNNMLSIGLCFINDNCEILYNYEANILPRTDDGRNYDENTMINFWNKEENKDAWNFIQTNQHNYKIVMKELSIIFTKYSKIYKLKFVAHPASFDWAFFKSYYETTKLLSPELKMYDIGYSCLCSSTLWNLYKTIFKLDNPIQYEEKYKELSEINSNTRNHFALDDAKHQGIAFIKIKYQLENQLKHL